MERPTNLLILWLKIHLELCLLVDFWLLPSFYICPALPRVWSYPVAALEPQSPGNIRKRNTLPNVRFLKLSFKKCKSVSKIHQSENTQYKPNDFSTFWFPRDPSLVNASRGTGLGLKTFSPTPIAINPAQCQDYISGAIAHLAKQNTCFCYHKTGRTRT